MGLGIFGEDMEMDFHFDTKSNIIQKKKLGFVVEISENWGSTRVDKSKITLKSHTQVNHVPPLNK